jgi:hypothetical protein
VSGNEIGNNDSRAFSMEIIVLWSVGSMPKIMLAHQHKISADAEFDVIFDDVNAALDSIYGYVTSALQM